MTTALEVFTMTMAMADQLDESNGLANPTDTDGYKYRTPSILTTLQAELIKSGYPQVTEGDIEAISAITDNVQVDDAIARTLMVYGLGMELFKEENETVYSHFLSRFEKLKLNPKLKPPATEVQITDYYS